MRGPEILICKLKWTASTQERSVVREPILFYSFVEVHPTHKVVTGLTRTKVEQYWSVNKREYGMCTFSPFIETRKKKLEKKDPLSVCRKILVYGHIDLR